MLSLNLVLQAAKSCHNLHVSVDSPGICKQEAFSAKTIEELRNWVSISSNVTDNDQMVLKKEWGNCLFKAIFIPCDDEVSVHSLTLKVDADEYFLDVIAKHLAVPDSSHVVISRSLSNAPSETRLYFPFHESFISNCKNAQKNCGLKENVRASGLASQNIYGDAILAAVGSSWKSKGTIFCEDISLGTYQRMVLSRIPQGSYKLSRNALLVAELPYMFSTRTKWRGQLPRDMLCSFCHYNRLLEPKFDLFEEGSDNSTNKIKLSSSPQKSCSKDESISALIKKDVKLEASCVKQNHESNHKSIEGGYFKCSVKLFSKAEVLLLEAVTPKSYRNQKDAIQSASLEALKCINKGIEMLCLHDESFQPFQASVLPAMADVSESMVILEKSPFQNLASVRLCCSQRIHNHFQDVSVDDTEHSHIADPDFNESSVNGTIVAIQYDVHLVGSFGKKCLERHYEFEFEINSGSVIKQLENTIMRMSVDQSVSFCANVPHRDIILAAAHENAEEISCLSLGQSHLEYNIKLLRIMETPEQRMEQALFSPPLSKQRMEFALQLLLAYHAKSMVDLGCGSGSLFDSLLEKETGLKQISGVDISLKGLIRSAKILHSKISAHCKYQQSSSILESATLYEGSITEFDQRIHGPDLATCIEVIEHMEERDAIKFGECVLGMICPHVLLISTPNYEYNALLQKGTLDGDEFMDDVESKSDLPWKFRNYDHKFEWTRKQFNDWAWNLAEKHDYDVEFSGVGGSANVEPGFASQMAIFKRRFPLKRPCLSTRDMNLCKDSIIGRDVTLPCPYKVVWEWKST